MRRNSLMEPKHKRPVALITGASSGIGAALAREYAHRGFNLSLCARRIERLNELAREIIEVETLVLKTDVNSLEDQTQAVAQTIEKFGRLDVAIANAGFGVVGPVEELSIEDYERQFETNVFGLLKTVRTSLPELKKTSGRIALMGSVASYISLGGTSAYSMSKFAVKALADSLYHEVRDSGVSVTLICPGFVQSEIRQVDNKGALHPEKKDPIPKWLAAPAKKSARQMARAIQARKREVVITGHGKFLVWLQRHFPAFNAFIVKLFAVRGRPEPE